MVKGSFFKGLVLGGALYSTIVGSSVYKEIGKDVGAYLKDFIKYSFKNKKPLLDTNFIHISETTSALFLSSKLQFIPVKHTSSGKPYIVLSAKQPFFLASRDVEFYRNIYFMLPNDKDHYQVFVFRKSLFLFNQDTNEFSAWQFTPKPILIRRWMPPLNCENCQSPTLNYSARITAYEKTLFLSLLKFRGSQPKPCGSSLVILDTYLNPSNPNNSVMTHRFSDAFGSDDEYLER